MKGDIKHYRYTQQVDDTQQSTTNSTSEIV